VETLSAASGRGGDELIMWTRSRHPARHFLEVKSAGDGRLEMLRPTVTKSTPDQTNLRLGCFSVLGGTRGKHRMGIGKLQEPRYITSLSHRNSKI
jgi:hypothetical protein